MSFFTRSLAAVLAVIGAGAVGCGDNPAGPDPAGSASGKPAAANQVKKPDPLVTKTFKAESCYYGALSLKLARTAYMDSLGDAEPSKDKVPDFGAEPLEIPPTKDGAPLPPGSAAPQAGSAAPKAVGPGASGKPA